MSSKSGITQGVTPTKCLQLIKIDPYIAAEVTNYLKHESSKVPFDILEGLVHSAVYGDEKCQALLLHIHNDCLDRLDSYTHKERRLLRKGYLVLDLICLAISEFTSWDVVKAVRRHLFQKPHDAIKWEDKVFASFIHHAVRNNFLPRTTAIQTLLLVNGCDSDYESEVEKAVFEDKELFGPDGYIYSNDGKVIDRPHDWCFYNDFVNKEELEEAPTTIAEVQVRVRAYHDEHEKYLVGDQRPGALKSGTPDRDSFLGNATSDESLRSAKPKSCSTSFPYRPCMPLQRNPHPASANLLLALRKGHFRRPKRLVEIAKQHLRRDKDGE